MNKKIVFQKIVIYTLSILIVGSLALIPVMIVKQKNKVKPTYEETEIQDIDDLPDTTKSIINANNEEKKSETIESNEAIIKEEKEKIDKMVEKESTTKEYQEYEKLPEEEKEKVDVIPKKEKIDFKELETIKEKIGYDEDKTYPSKYNTFENTKVKIENQKSYGLCWDFAALNVLEAYMYKKEGILFDYSEVHLDYMQSRKLFGSRTEHTGGTFLHFKDYSAMTGVVLETKELDYDKSYTQEELSKFTDLNQEVQVTETVSYPNMSKNLDTYSEEKEKEFRNAIKYHIMKYGAISAVISCEFKTGDIFCETYEYPNLHGVAVVGWDDNYPKEKFTSSNGNTPEHDGAYLVQNSWGENFGYNGYLYISYDDMYIEADMNGIINTGMDGRVKLSAFSSAIRKMLKEKYSLYIDEIDGEEYISKVALSTIGELDLSGLNLTTDDIESLKYFNELNSLNLDNNNITNIDALNNINNLYSISVKNNNIKDISNLKSNNIYILELDGNKGIRGYSNKENLKLLSLVNCDITDIEDLSNLNTLNTVILKDNENLNIDYSKLPSTIYKLDLTNTNLNDIENISLKNISSLYIGLNPITSIKGIEKLKGISLIDISNTNIKDLERINDAQNGNDSFRSISIIMANSKLEDVSIFNNINSLISLDVSNNNITDISKLDNNSLSSITLSGNKITKGFDKIVNIEEIYLDNCGLTNLNDFVELNTTNYIDLSNNEINNIDNIEVFKNVKEINLTNNNIKDITPINKLTNLESLSLEGNKNIEGTLDSNVSMLNVGNCNLKSFNIDNLTQLRTLNISNKEIENIEEIIEKQNSRNYAHIIMENIEIDKSLISDIQTKYDKVQLSKPTLKLKLQLPYDSNTATLDNMERKLFINNDGLPYNDKIMIDKYYKDITVDDDSEEYEINTYYRDTQYVGNIKLILSFERLDETNFRKRIYIKG